MRPLIELHDGSKRLITYTTQLNCSAGLGKVGGCVFSFHILRDIGGMRGTDPYRSKIVSNIINGVYNSVVTITFNGGYQAGSIATRDL